MTGITNPGTALWGHGTAPGTVTDLTAIGDTIPVGIRLTGITPGGAHPTGTLRTGSLNIGIPLIGTSSTGIMTGFTPDGATGIPITIHTIPITIHTRQTAITNLPTEQTTETHVA